MPSDMHLPTQKTSSADNQTLTLNYHNISNGIHIGLNSISPIKLKSHLEFINYYYDSNIHLNKPTISFDDGYESVYTNAYPLIQQYGLKCIIFPVSAYIGKWNDWDVNFRVNRTKHININQLQDLSDNNWIIGSHGHNHRSCTKMNTKDIRMDLEQSKGILEEITGKTITDLSPPFGKLTFDYIKIAEDVGYKKIYIQNPVSYKNIFKSDLDIIYRRGIYSIDGAKTILNKIKKSKLELLKENIIHSFCNATIMVKELL